MKIRTDFVTNSSSSSYIITITISTRARRDLFCEMKSGEEDCSYSHLAMHKSPAELGQCRTIDELIEMLKGAVTYSVDESFDEEYVEEVNDKNYVDSGLQRMIENVRKLESMDEIESVSVDGSWQGHNGAETNRTYTYYRDQRITVCDGDQGETNDHEEHDQPDDEDWEMNDEDMEYYADYDYDNPPGELTFKIEGEKANGTCVVGGRGYRSSESWKKACLTKELNGVTYSYIQHGNTTELIRVRSDTTNLSELQIPDELIQGSKVTCIAENALDSLYRLEKVTVPGSITSIGEGVFRTYPKKTTIITQSGTYAESYAKEHGMPLEYI